MENVRKIVKRNMADKEPTRARKVVDAKKECLDKRDICGVQAETHSQHAEPHPGCDTEQRRT